MDLNLILSFLGASFILALMPGPDNIYVLTESITRGHKFGIAITCGLVSGVLVHTLAAASGLSLLLKSSTIAYESVKYFGFLYLLYLAFQSYKAQIKSIELDHNESAFQKFDFWRLYKQGILMNVLNPKVAIFFMAFLPQFLTPNGLNVTLQLVVLGILFMTQAFLVFSSIALLSYPLFTIAQSPSFWSITRWIQVAVLVLLAIGLLLSD